MTAPRDWPDATSPVSRIGLAARLAVAFFAAVFFPAVVFVAVSFSARFVAATFRTAFFVTVLRAAVFVAAAFVAAFLLAEDFLVVIFCGRPAIRFRPVTRRSDRAKGRLMGGTKECMAPG